MKLNIAKLLIGLASLLVSPWAGAITYTYDDLNRLASVSYDDGAKIAYAYDASGNMSSVTKTPPGAAGSTTTTSAASITTTTTSGATTTTTASTTTTTVSGTGGGGVTLNFAVGWNLVGHSGSGSVLVPMILGDPALVTTVWKWIPGVNKWAFYAPSLVGHALLDYAASKGYDVLSNINGGEGFWVNAKSAFTAQLPSGTAISSASFQSMGTGWNLIAVGDSPTPSGFNKAISATPPAAGDIPINLTTLWAWDAVLTNWYFYAPSLEKSGGLAAYITSKSYLDFDTKVLTPTTGFWVNKP